MARCRRVLSTVRGHLAAPVAPNSSGAAIYAGTTGAISFLEFKQAVTTDGGEALLHDNGKSSGIAQWYVLWTQCHCERVVCDQLIAKGFEIFLPTIRTWSRQRGVRKTIALPMFPGYTFIRHAIDKHSYVEVLKTRGVVRILGDGWERLTAVRDSEVEAIQRIVHADLPVLPHAYLREGQLVRITDGPLTGVEGVLVHSKPNKGLVVISVDLLRRSVAVEVDGTQVAPAGPALPLIGSRPVEAFAV